MSGATELRRAVEPAYPELLAEAWKPWSELESGEQDAELVRLAEAGAAFAELAHWMGVEEERVSLGLRRARERLALDAAKTADRGRQAERARAIAAREQARVEAREVQEQEARKERERAEAKARAKQERTEKRAAQAKPAPAGMPGAGEAPAPVVDADRSAQEVADDAAIGAAAARVKARHDWEKLTQPERDWLLFDWRDEQGCSWSQMALLIGTTAPAASRMYAAAERRRAEEVEIAVALEQLADLPAAPEDVARSAPEPVAAPGVGPVAAVDESGVLEQQVAQSALPSAETFYPVSSAHPWQVRQLWVVLDGSGHIVLATSSYDVAAEFLPEDGEESDDVEDD